LVSEDWAAVAEAINERVAELGWRQRELAERSHVSPAIVREIQRHTVERRRSPRTLESLSTTLGWEPQHLDAVLRGGGLAGPGKPANGSRETTSSRLDAIERRLAGITQILADIKTDLATVIERVGNHR
jgi:transcriptional regulator with XRE-family HTH domain